MIENLINFISWISDLQRRTHDPVLNKYRAYQWRMVLSICGAMFFLLVAWLFFPQETPNTGIKSILAVPLAYAEFIVDMLIAISCIVYLVNAIQFWMFCKKHEIWF